MTILHIGNLQRSKTSLTSVQWPSRLVQLCRGARLPSRVSSGQVDWCTSAEGQDFHHECSVAKSAGATLQRGRTSLTSVQWPSRLVHLCRGVRLHSRVSWIWHLRIWWFSFRNAKALGNVEFPFIDIAPRFTLTRSGSTLFGPIYGSNRTKLCTYAKLNFLKLTVFTITRG